MNFNYNHVEGGKNTHKQRGAALLIAPPRAKRALRFRNNSKVSGEAASGRWRMGASGCGLFFKLIFYRKREQKTSKDILRADFKCCHINSRLTSLWRNVTCVLRNNPIIYIKIVFNIMPMWKYIHTVCLQLFSRVNAISPSLRPFNFLC